MADLRGDGWREGDRTVIGSQRLETSAPKFAMGACEMGAVEIFYWAAAGRLSKGQLSLWSRLRAMDVENEARVGGHERGAVPRDGRQEGNGREMRGALVGWANGGSVQESNLPMSLRPFIGFEVQAQHRLRYASTAPLTLSENGMRPQATKFPFRACLFPGRP